MTCAEIRRLLGLHLDSELSAETASALARHLEACPSCADRIRAEERLEARIRGALRRPEPEDREAWRRAVESIPRRRRLWPWIAAAAISAFALIAFLATRHRELDLADEMAKHHAKYVEGRAPLGVESPDPAESARYFREKLPFESAPGPLPENTRMVGARMCYLKGAPAAFYVLHRDRSAVLVAVFAAADLSRFPRIEARLAHGLVHCRVEGKSFVAARDASRVVTAVGDVAPAELEAIAAAFLPR